MELQSKKKSVWTAFKKAYLKSRNLKKFWNRLEKKNLPEDFIKIFEEFINLVNPTNNIITIQGYLDTQTKIGFHNNLGKLVMQTAVDFQGVISKQFDLTHLPTGVYFIRIQNMKEKIIKKVVKL